MFDLIHLIHDSLHRVNLVVGTLSHLSLVPLRFTAPVCLCMVYAILFELSYRTESESEEEEDAICLLDHIASTALS